MKNRFNVVIIGAGRIGAFYDSPRSKNILTHAHAFSVHPGFKLLGFIDSDRAQAAKAAKAWGVGAWPNLKAACAHSDIDIAVVAASVAAHAPIMKALAGYQALRLILLEKPMAKTIKEAQAMMRSYRSKKSPAVAVNYFRDYLPEIGRIKSDIRRGRYGRFVSGTGSYARGIFGDSHILDLVRNLLGPIAGYRVISHRPGFAAGDPIVSARLNLKRGGEFYLNGLSKELPTMLELDLFFAKQRIRISDLGQRIETYQVGPSRLFPAYRSLRKVSDKAVASFPRYMYHVVDNIYRHLQNRQPLKCLLADSYEVFQICDRLAKRAVRAGR